MPRATSASADRHMQHMHADVSPAHLPGDPPAIIARSDAEVSRTTFSVEGDPRGGGLIPAMYFPAR